MKITIYLVGGSLGLLAAQDAAAQRLGLAANEPEISPWRVLGALLICLLLAAGAAFALRQRLRGGFLPVGTQSRRLQLADRLKLSHQVDLCLVDCEGRRIIVAVSQQGVIFGPELDVALVESDPA
jgi:flagellar biogenesis protein FliO